MVTVSVVDVVPGGVTVAGEKLHVATEGKPEQLKETAEVNPPVGVMTMLVVTLCPAFTAADAGEAATEKPGGRLIV